MATGREPAVTVVAGSVIVVFADTTFGGCVTTTLIVRLVALPTWEFPSKTAEIHCLPRFIRGSVTATEPAWPGLG